MKIVLLGIQGSGKSTQGNLLRKKLGIPYLSTGHIFRELAKEHTPLGRYIKETMNAGYLIPDKKTLEIVSEYLKRPTYQKGYILDGFPRTVKQAEDFENGINIVVYLHVSDREALWRLSYRFNDDGREDETLQALRKRIEIYHKFTDPVLAYYEKKKMLVEIDGEQGIDEIHKEVLNNLKSIKENGKEKIVVPYSKKTVIAIVGMAGAGKSEAATFFKERGTQALRFGSVIDEGLKEKGLPWTVENDKKYRNEIRQELGMEAVAVKMLPKIQQALQTPDPMLVLDGLYSWEEYFYLQKHLPRLVLLAIYARPKIRYHRLGHRKERTFTEKEARIRDINEIEKTNKGGPIAIADYLVKNETTREELHMELEKFLALVDNL